MSQFLDVNTIADYFKSQLTAPVENYASYMSAKALDDFAVQLVEYRIQHKLNQKELAQLLGISQPMVSQYEAGINNITVKRLCEISEKIGVRVRIDYEDADQPARFSMQSDPYRCDLDVPKSEELAA